MLALNFPLVQGTVIGYVTANSMGEFPGLKHILRVLQALNPDATDPRGEVVGQKFTSPFFFS
ncbi:hypothetical protein C0V75_04300 [Tabrizicola sp. TH137]|nr:hypothetical protein C0V75_04300 [Tabrizicola sp. TH137]